MSAAHIIPSITRLSHREISALGGWWADWIERLACLSLYFRLVWRSVESYQSSGQLPNLLLLASEGPLIVFVLLRRRTDAVSRRPSDWLLAFTAGCGPLLVSPEANSVPLVPPALAAFFLLFGIFTQVSAKIALGRSFGVVAANRGLKRRGPYRLVRHPMYAGYLLTHLAFLAMNPTAWNLAVYLIADGLQIPRLLAEERVLGQDVRYQEYRRSVRYRLLPGLF